MKGNRVNCFSSKERLAESLRALQHVAPVTLEVLSSVNPRYRRIVARDPNFLFEKPHLVEQYVEQLIPGWWHGTNNNDQQKQVWLKRACSLAGLTWGVDFRMGPDSSLPPAMDL